MKARARLWPRLALAVLLYAVAALLVYAAYSDPRALPVEHGLPPTSGQLKALDKTRTYDVPPAAIMSVTIEEIGIQDAPVFGSDSWRALNAGIGHVPETSLPHSDTPERNVYLAGHRLGWPLTRGRLTFYELGELRNGDRVTLEDDRDRTYEYRVVDKFVVGPNASWVMGRVRGQDLLTLQTCTLPDLDKRLVVRAERV